MGLVGMILFLYTVAVKYRQEENADEKGNS